jgi:hypothetical protein
MKKLILMIVCWLLVVVPVVGAQNTLWELDTEFPVTDLQIVFDIPASWVSVSRNGVFLAENSADLAALMDNDNATQPAGYTMTLTTVPVTSLRLDEFSLEDAAPQLLQGMRISQTYETAAVARAVYGVTGVNAQGRAVISHLWLQDGQVVTFSLNTPDNQVSRDATFTWTTINETIRPLLGEDVEIEAVRLADRRTEVGVPTDWVAVSTESFTAFFESQEDAQYFNQNGEFLDRGSVMLITMQTLEQLGLDEETTIEDLIAWTGIDFSQRGFTDQGRFVVEGYPGFGYSVIDPNLGTGTYSVITLSDEGAVTIYNLITPNARTLTAMTPVFMAMLQNIES